MSAKTGAITTETIERVNLMDLAELMEFQNNLDLTDINPEILMAVMKRSNAIATSALAKAPATLEQLTAAQIVQRYRAGEWQDRKVTGRERIIKGHRAAGVVVESSPAQRRELYLASKAVVDLGEDFIVEGGPAGDAVLVDAVQVYNALYTDSKLVEAWEQGLIAAGCVSKAKQVAKRKLAAEARKAKAAGNGEPEPEDDDSEDAVAE